MEDTYTQRSVFSAENITMMDACDKRKTRNYTYGARSKFCNKATFIASNIA